MRLIVVRDADELADRAARLFRERVQAKPGLVIAAPAGRTPRRMYDRMRALQAEAPTDFSAMHLYAVDELAPPAPPDGYFWRQIRRELLAWAAVTADRCHPFGVDAPDLEAMCDAYERSITQAGGLDLVMLGLGPNAHIASNEPGTSFGSRTRPVRLLPATVAYILTDEIIQGAVSDHAVTLGMATIVSAREVMMLVSGASKRQALHLAIHGPVTPDVPASILQHHANATVIADRDAAP